MYGIRVGHSQQSRQSSQQPRQPSRQQSSHPFSQQASQQSQFPMPYLRESYQPYGPPVEKYTPPIGGRTPGFSYSDQIQSSIRADPVLMNPNGCDHLSHCAACQQLVQHLARQNSRAYNTAADTNSCVQIAMSSTALYALGAIYTGLLLVLIILVLRR